MTLEDDQQLANTEHKLWLLEQQIDRARTRPRTDANLASVRSLVQTANQLREEITRFKARATRAAS